MKKGGLLKLLRYLNKNIRFLHIVKIFFFNKGKNKTIFMLTRLNSSQMLLPKYLKNYCSFNLNLKTM